MEPNADCMQGKINTAEPQMDRASENPAEGFIASPPDYVMLQFFLYSYHRKIKTK